MDHSSYTTISITLLFGNFLNFCHVLDRCGLLLISRVFYFWPTLYNEAVVAWHSCRALIRSCVTSM